MAVIRPFHALSYNPEKITDLSAVITQPYDKISPAMQSRYYAASPYNLVRIIRGRETPDDTAQNSVYSRAADTLHRWIGERILISTEKPGIFPYSQAYSLPGSPETIKERRGFIALLGLEDYSARVVHRHEETLSGPKADRMELLKYTRAHFGQVFLLYSDPLGSIEGLLAPVAKSSPWESMTDEYGTRHSVWKLAEEAPVSAVVGGMKDKKLLIADGHHRYETALAFRNLMRETAGYDGRADYVMATFIRMETGGLTILPTHRVVHGLRSFAWPAFQSQAQRAFDWKDLDASLAFAGSEGKLQSMLEASGRDRPAFIAYAGAGKLALLTLRPDFNLAGAMPELSEDQRRLDVIVLHRLLIEQSLGITLQDVRAEKNLHFVRGLSDAAAAVDSGKGQICFLMNPAPIDAVRNIAFGGQVMPQKSTDFFPKLLTGLTIYWLENPLGV